MVLDRSSNNLTSKVIVLKDRVKHYWDNLSFRSKLTSLLIASAALPLLVLTQLLYSYIKEIQLEQLKQTLDSNSRSFTEDYVVWTKVESAASAQKLAKVIEISKIDPSNSKQVTANLNFLQNLIEIENGSDAEINKNFQIITNAQGKIIAQNIQILENYFLDNKLPDLDRPLAKTRYRTVKKLEKQTGIDLSSIEIVNNVLQKERSLSGLELLNSESLKLLGLEELAEIPINSQQSNLETTYNVENGKIGLVSMAVQPLIVNDQLVGTIIVGALLNHNYPIVDEFSQEYKVSASTIFAKDLQVNTNAPNDQEGTRAIGTRASTEVTETVLDRGKDFSKQTKIFGREYLTYYRPLYDHHQQINPQEAKPVGMTLISEPTDLIEDSLRKAQITAYGIGLLISAIIGAIAIPVAKSFSAPLKRITDFTEKVASGERGVRLKAIERQDEMGILTARLNQMAEAIEINLESKIQETERSQLLAKAEEEREKREEIQQQLYKLLMDVEAVSQGNLTVRAEIDQGEIGIVADFLNAVVENLRDIVIRVKQAATQVNAAIGENEGAIRQLTEETLQQTNQINLTLQEVAMMNASIQAVANSAETAAKIATTASEQAQMGGKAMDRTVESILQLRTTISETSKKVKRLGESSQQISQAVSLIDRIAMQTNLLAVNASIEATRAGEEGRGFAVVAEEVGQLAIRSTDATKLIQAIVANIQRETSEVVEAMEVGTTQVIKGTYCVEDAKRNLVQIMQVSTQIDRLLQSISSATVSQATTSESVRELMQEITEISRRTSDSSHQISIALQQTVEIAQQLQTSVSAFKVD